VRTPLTYYGGKQQLAQRIVALMPPHKVYFEPFAGGAAVLFAKPRAQRETLNDLDGRVMRFWRALRERPDELAQAVMLTPYSRSEWEACKAEPDPEDDVEAARRFIVWVDQSFSREGTGWSPPSILFDRRGRWQAGVWENLPDKLVAAATRLAGVALENGDALDLIPRYDQPDAVIYCDPPYAPETRLEPAKGYRHDVDGDFWPRLCDALQDVKHASVLLSGYPCQATEDLGWQAISLPRKRSVQARAGSTLSNAPEVLWRNSNAPATTLFEEALSA
jgi:DNA adenine methylase